MDGRRGQCRFIAVLGRDPLHLHQVKLSISSLFFTTVTDLRPLSRFYQGTAHAERTYEAEVDYDEHARKVIGQIKQIRRYRHWGQPYVSTLGPILKRLAGSAMLDITFAAGMVCVHRLFDRSFDKRMV